MKRYIPALLILLGAPMPLLAQRSADSERVCYAQYSHASQRECLTSRAKESEARLEAAEASARSALLRAGQGTEERALAAQAFDKSVAEYRRYRSQQCEFVASLAFGGNAQGDRRLLCEIELNEGRIRQIRADLKHTV